MKAYLIAGALALTCDWGAIAQVTTGGTGSPDPGGVAGIGSAGPSMPASKSPGPQKPLPPGSTSMTKDPSDSTSSGKDSTIVGTTHSGDKKDAHDTQSK